MPRPRKCRKVCFFPETLAFVPVNSDREEVAITLTVDEYETIRLIDKEGFSQEQCAERMQVARTTVQQIYAGARKKLADVLVEGRPLLIEGGDYKLCNGIADCRSCRGCFKHKISRQYKRLEGDVMMRIAVTFENGEVFQHFGHTENFKIYDVEDGKVARSEVVDTNGQGHGALADVLSALHVDTLICGGIGGGAQAALNSNGIKFYGGVSGNADEAVDALLSGRLVFDPEVHCSHHDHEGGQHSCGHHGCHE